AEKLVVTSSTMMRRHLEKRSSSNMRSEDLRWSEIDLTYIEDIRSSILSGFIPLWVAISAILSGRNEPAQSTKATAGLDGSLDCSRSRSMKYLQVITAF